MDRFVSFRFLKALSLCVVTAAAGCAGGGDAEVNKPLEGDRISVVDGREFDELFVVVDSLVLEESETVVTVRPEVSLDLGGGFLVADSREHQVRVYSPTGELEQVFGVGTERVDSIRRPYDAVRMTNGDILVGNVLGPITVIPKRPTDPSWFIPSPLRTVRNFEMLTERDVLFVGPDSAPAAASLHIWDSSRREIVKSFFPPPQHLDQGVTVTFPSVRTAIKGNLLAAVYTLSDTLVLFDLAGTEISRIRIPIDPFIAPTGPLPQVATPAERQAWVNQFTHIMSVFWIEDDQLIVQWAKGTGLGVDWGLVQVDTTGRRVWAVAPAPRLLAVRNDEFFFQDPRAGARNRWLVAKQNLEILTCLKSHRSTNYQGEESCAR